MLTRNFSKSKVPLFHYMEPYNIIWKIMAKKNYYQINSIVKAFKLIECLVSEEEFELSELSRRLQFPKTTAHRMLLTLESLGYVEQNQDNKRYRASIKFFELGWKVAAKINLIDLAHEFMVDLAKKTGETINLGILDGLEIICVDKVRSEHPLSHDQPVGTRHKAYSSGFGKAVLAFLPEDEREGLFKDHTIIPDTGRSLKSIIDVERDLRKIRNRGYSVDNEEGITGIRCVGAPIFGNDGRVIAGMSIAGPVMRIKMDLIPDLGKLVKKTAGSISIKLGAGRHL